MAATGACSNDLSSYLCVLLYLHAFVYSQTIECLGGIRTEGIFRRPGHAGAKAAFMAALYEGDYSILRRYRDISVWAVFVEASPCTPPRTGAVNGLRVVKQQWVQPHAILPRSR